MRKAIAFIGIVVFSGSIPGGTSCRSKADAVLSGANTSEPSVSIPAQALGLEHLSTSYAEAKASAKQEGIPLTPADLVQPSIPEAENAAPIYRQLAEMHIDRQLTQMHSVERTFPGSTVDHITSKQMPDEAQLAQIRTVLEANPDVLALVHKGAALPKCGFARDFSLGRRLLFPEYSTLRSAMRFITAESTVMLADGRPFDAITNETLGFTIAHHAATDPTMTANMVATSMDAITLQCLQKILYTAGDSPGVAAAVAKSIAENWRPHSYQYALGGESVMWGVLLEGLHKNGRGSDGADAIYKEAKQKSGDILTWAEFLDSNSAYIVDMLRLVHDAAELPYPGTLVTVEKIASEEQKNTSGEHVFRLSGSFSQAALSVAGNQARADLVRAAASVLAWRQTHSAFPTSLKESMSEELIDPFDGKPLHYRLVGNGFVVYSVGQTGKFDGIASVENPDANENAFVYP